MRKVTTINLGGRAYQLEDEAYDKLKTYLHRAETRLADNPDKAEIVADLEQAIADKCERLLKGDKNVITTAELARILDQMGEVETDADEHKTHAASSEPGAGKRLFIIRENAVLMGVCQGIGAYFGIESNLIRLAFVLITIFTGGFWIIVYLGLGIFLPVAKTDAELAEAYGRPVTAQAIVAQVKDRAPAAENLRLIIGLADAILRVIAKIIAVAAALIFGLLTAALIWTLWQLALGQFQFSAQLQVLNGWREWLAVIAVYLTAALPVFLIFRVFDRVSEHRKQTRLSVVSESSLAVLWAMAIITLIAFGTAYAQNFRDYSNAHHGHISVNRGSICVNGSLCNPGVRNFYKINGPVKPY